MCFYIVLATAFLIIYIYGSITNRYEFRNTRYCFKY